MSHRPIKDALQALNRHAEVIEQAVMGGTVAQDSLPKPAVQALRQASALRPAGRDEWRLHPRLREYLQDHLQMFPKFQSLTDIGAKLNLIQMLHSDALSAVAERDYESLESQLAAIETAVFDIADATDRNLTFLAGMVSTRYGDVRTLAAKLAQNRWYLKQSSHLGHDLNRLGRVVSQVEKEAEERGWVLAGLIRRALLSKAHVWQHGLSDIQTQIREEIFRTRQIEANLRNLARADQFLSQNPSWPGFERDVEGLPAVFLRAFLPKLVPRVEPTDSDSGVRQDLRELVVALPPKKVAAPPIPAPVLQVSRSSEADGDEESSASPAALALADLMRSILSAKEALSVLEWQRRNESASQLSPGVWVFFATTALEAGPHRVDGKDVEFELEILANPPGPGRRFSRTFRDARVRALKVRPARGARREGAKA
jgi:hypothetical protein